MYLWVKFSSLLAFWRSFYLSKEPFFGKAVSFLAFNIMDVFSVKSLYPKL